MTSKTFATQLIDCYPGLDESLAQHLSMFLESDQRERFFDFIGFEYEDDE